MMDLKNIRCILLDIEGTTTSIAFVKQTLFRYVEHNVSQYVIDHWNDPSTKAVVDALTEQSEIDVSSGVKKSVCIPRLSATPTPEEISMVQQAVCKNVLWQMSLDSKATALKQLQGHMWAKAYKTKEISGHMYPDVPDALSNWQTNGIKIYIYSSGSVEAQKLLFENSTHGNLLTLINGHFDTTVGSKTDSSSYRKILKELDTEGNSILFLTDVPNEAYAAQEAGLCAALVIRPGNLPLTVEHQEAFHCIYSFDKLKL